jgi:hypothetical protein
MRQEDLEKEITKLERKFNRDGRESLVKELRGLTNDQRRERLKQQAILAQEITDNKDKASRVPETAEAISKVRDHNSLFREQSDNCKRIARFIHLLIEDSGKI